MEFPDRFSNLPDYAFPRLRALLDHHPAGGDVVHMTIGEPKHSFPTWVSDILSDAMCGLNSYPANDGTPELRNAIADWVKRRFAVGIDADTQVLALNGTREGLYNAAMALLPELKNGQTPVVLIPNPFYQVYMIASISVGAKQVFVPADAENGFLPDYASLPAGTLNRTVAAYICSPSNPQGAIASRAYLETLIGLAEKYDFRIFADECYSEIYRGDTPVGALQVAHEMGADPERVVIFHSLSKRSNLPGLRSGFAAGGPKTIAHMKRLRAYSGAPLPGPLQAVSALVWQDEAHVVENRALYSEKFDAADHIFAGIDAYHSPEAGFFLWLNVGDGEESALRLWQETGVRVLPGRYLSKETEQGAPGAPYIRVALVAPKKEAERGLIRLRDCLYN